MGGRRFTNLLISFLVLLLAMTTSCQKDPAVKDPDTSKVALSTDSTNVGVIASSPGNFLATTVFLNIKIKDSTYTFVAAHDSIAFVNVHVDEDNRYFGITAINKEHTMSFGISSSGFVYSNTNNGIAGSQFLLNPDDEKHGMQFSLSRYSGQKDFGNIKIVQYNQGNVLAKGSFFTFLAKDDKANSPFYRVEGSFDLKLNDKAAN
jgi:hypothetical protein